MRISKFNLVICLMIREIREMRKKEEVHKAKKIMK